MTHVDEVLPSIKDLYFPGKPVTTDKGEAFVISSTPNGNQLLFILTEIIGDLKIQYSKGKQTEVVSKEEIKEERDND